MPTEQGPGVHSVVLLLFALFLIASPFAAWLIGTLPAWWLPYCLWGGLIVLIGLLSRRTRRHEL